jgi:DNA-binding NarL/FixJ family response regulator
MGVIRIVLTDDQELVRTGFRLVLGGEQDMEVVGEASDGAEAITVTEQTRPDVVVMDIRMPRMDGVEATRHIRASGDAPRVLS